jgi:predicted nucleic acid-binding protein
MSFVEAATTQTSTRAERVRSVADTSGWASLADPLQPLHGLAASIYRAVREQNRSIITTNYVLAELAALMTSPLRIERATIVGFVEDINASPQVEVLHIDEMLDKEAWQLFASRLDKEWSLVDCSSFAIMQRRGITEALTTDHHFEQAGFVRLLK